MTPSRRAHRLAAFLSFRRPDGRLRIETRLSGAAMRGNSLLAFPSNRGDQLRAAALGGRNDSDIGQEEERIVDGERNGDVQLT